VASTGATSAASTDALIVCKRTRPADFRRLKSPFALEASADFLMP
jgi:hypothetical protein